jgi:hypothetical protein
VLKILIIILVVRFCLKNTDVADGVTRGVYESANERRVIQKTNCCADVSLRLLLSLCIYTHSIGIIYIEQSKIDYLHFYFIT